MIAALSAEWLKIRSLRSTYALLAVVVAGLAGAAALCGYLVTVYDGADPSMRAHISVAPVAGLVGSMTELLAGVLGTLAITGEYRSGTIRASLAAVPRRGRLFAAKAAAIAGIGLVAGEAAVFCGYAISHGIVGDRTLLLDSRGFAEQAPLLVAQGLTVLLFALLGLSLGTVTRSAAGTIPVLVLLWYILPIVANLLPQPWHGRIGSIVPDALPGQLAGVGNDHSVYGALLPPWGAGLAMAAWIVLPLAAAAVVFGRRDTR
ncbi:ABC transporter permease [Actinocatenispora thailandica]|uniref:ABC transporter permease n=1 Tax=Actinocatenispora thailandica TaxID=227318 RepID=A0A7R7DNF4_9ACTN|nr:ABC transporter permease subunit [Actinocatenispora thailandica]BCJ34711.1 ABC transporter permease [Actinocatenispora thailandica]